MGWGRPAPLLCELNLLGRPYGAGWINKESLRAFRLLKKFFFSQTPMATWASRCRPRQTKHGPFIIYFLCFEIFMDHKKEMARLVLQLPGQAGLEETEKWLTC